MRLQRSNMSRINEVMGNTQLSLLWICVIVAAMVFVALMYSTALFHRGEFAVRDRTQDRVRKAARELGWAIVPIFIVVAAAAPAMQSAVAVRHDRSLVTENRSEACRVAVNISTARILPAAAIDCAKHR
jgi:heme/copper-type cytochrome/quinol oxidase subunit 2